MNTFTMRVLIFANLVMLFSLKVLGQDCKYVNPAHPFLFLESPKFDAERKFTISAQMNLTCDSLIGLKKDNFKFKQLEVNYINKDGIVIDREQIPPTGYDNERRTYNSTRNILTEIYAIEYSLHYGEDEKNKKTSTFKYYGTCNNNRGQLSNPKLTVKVEPFFYSNDKTKLYMVVSANHDGVYLVKDKFKMTMDEKGTNSLAISTCQNDCFIPEKNKPQILVFDASLYLKDKQKLYFTLITQKDGAKYDSTIQSYNIVEKDRFYIKQIVGGDAVIGNIDSKMIVRTSSSKDAKLYLKFIENPLNSGVKFEDIMGKKDPDKGGEYIFDIKSSGFNYGNFEMIFYGEEENSKEPLHQFNNNSYHFTKKQHKVSEIQIETNKDGIKLEASLLDEKKSAEPITLEINGKEAFQLSTKTDNRKIGHIISQKDLMNNGYIDSTTKTLKIRLVVDNVKTETIYSFPIKRLDTDELKKISKKKNIKKYLIENNIQGDIDKIADTLATEAKSKQKKDWSETWSNVIPLIKPIVGIAMLII